MTSNEIRHWADPAMFEAAPTEESPSDPPRVFVLNATPDPLGAVAAMSMMYEGKVVHSLDEITDEQRIHYFQQIMKTHLKAPFEAVSIHFMLEGVTRSFTHQLVRQRTAVFAQESLRFAVKDNVAAGTALPPSLRALPASDERVAAWYDALGSVDDAYRALVDAGVPAEDARGLLPHNIRTRVNYVTGLRALGDHAGMRLCTQAQFEWRHVWASIVQTLDGYSSCVGDHHERSNEDCRLCDNWQWQMIARMFRPVCYSTGKCEFNASFDRKCSIRSRVNASHEVGRPSEGWDKVWLGLPSTKPYSKEDGVVRDADGRVQAIEPIDAREWMADPAAAR